MNHPLKYRKLLSLWMYSGSVVSVSASAFALKSSQVDTLNTKVKSNQKRTGKNRSIDKWGLAPQS